MNCNNKGLNLQNHLQNPHKHWVHNEKNEVCIVLTLLVESLKRWGVLVMLSVINGVYINVLHKRATISCLSVAYNNSFKKLLGLALDRRCSASNMFTESNVNSFDSIRRKHIFWF